MTKRSPFRYFKTSPEVISLAVNPQSSGISTASTSRRSNCFSSPITRRPTLVAWRWAASLSFVCRLCLRLASEMRCKPSGVLAPVDRLSLRAARTAHYACKRLSGAQCDPRCEEGNKGRHLLQLTVQIPPPPRQPPEWT